MSYVRTYKTYGTCITLINFDVLYGDHDDDA